MPSGSPRGRRILRHRPRTHRSEFPPAIPRRVAPQQSPLPLRRRLSIPHHRTPAPSRAGTCPQFPCLIRRVQFTLLAGKIVRSTETATATHGFNRRPYCAKPVQRVSCRTKSGLEVRQPHVAYRRNFAAVKACAAHNSAIAVVITSLETDTGIISPASPEAYRVSPHPRHAALGVFL